MGIKSAGSASALTAESASIKAANSVEQVPSKAFETLKQIEKNNLQSAPQGYKGGGIFNNKEILLPGQQKGYYQKWDINPKIQGIDRGLERVITGRNGEAWYTADHYKTFIKIK